MKKALLIALVLILALTFFACNKDDEFSFKDYENFKNSVKNYSITIRFDDDYLTFKKCENGFLYDNGDVVYFYNGSIQKGYILDKSEKTGIVDTYASGDAFYDIEASGGIIDYLFAFQYLKTLMQRDGSAKVAGRDCAVFKYEHNGQTAKYYLDKEYGICLKTEVSEPHGTDVMEVTGFTVGGISVDNMIDLSEYTIEEGENSGGEEPGEGKEIQSIQVKGDTIPVNATPATLNHSSIKIIVSYTDGSTSLISLSQSMLSQTDIVKLATVGTHTITVSYGGKTTTFTITLKGGASEGSTAMKSSYEAFYQSLTYDSYGAGFLPTLMLSFQMGEYKNYYDESISRHADTDQVSLPTLLNDVFMLSIDYEAGLFDASEVEFDNGEKRTPSFTMTENSISAKYAVLKTIVWYWFETDVLYDAATDSLKAVVYSGINEGRIQNGIIEYNRHSDGHYSVLIAYPNDSQDKYTIIKYYYINNAGKISISRQQSLNDVQQASVYGKADNANYADSGDIVFSTDGSTLTLVSTSLSSRFHDDYNRLLDSLIACYEFVYDADPANINNVNMSFNIGVISDAMEFFYIGDYRLDELIYTYDQKLDIVQYEYETISVSLSSGNYTVLYESEYYSHNVAVKSATDTFAITDSSNDDQYIRLQFVKSGSVYFVEMFDFDGIYYTQYLLAFNEDTNDAKLLIIYDLDEFINLNIFEAGNLNFNTFTDIPTGEFIYDSYSFIDFTLSYTSST